MGGSRVSRARQHRRPLGGGSNLIGCHLAFEELARRGQVDRRPRLFGVQTARCAPLQAACAAAADRLVPVDAGFTIAEGIAIARPVRVRENLTALRSTGGAAIAVEEQAIIYALRRLARQGLFVEPTSAVAAAGLEHLLAAGTIGRDEMTVLVLTGSGLKASEAIGRLLRLP